MKTFTAKDVVAITTVDYRTLDHWCRVGLIKPLKPAEGTGSERLYDLDDVLCVGLAVYLRMLGLETARIKPLVAQPRRLKTAHWLMVFLSDYVIWSNDEQMPSLHGDVCGIVVDLSVIRSIVDGVVRQL